MQAFHVLMVVTSATHMHAEHGATGSWLEEVVAPYYTFLDAKIKVTLASVAGGAAPIDPTSLKPENATAATRRYEADAAAQALLANTPALATLDTAAYDAIFFPGGHGTMVDFPTNAAIRQMVEAFYRAGKPVASVCHGPACLVQATKTNGEPLVAGHRFTCFSDLEETTVGLRDAVPFLLESRLSALGGKADIAEPFAAKVVADGTLVTGQNPASSIPAAEAVIYLLRKQQAHVAA